MKAFLFAVAFWGGALAGRAQNGTGVYSAPGMPLHLQRQPVQPAQPPTAPYIAARFWKLQDTAYVRAASAFYQYVGSRFRWPATTMQAGLEGTISVRLVLRPDGSVSRADIIGRTLHQATGYSEFEMTGRAHTDLDAETIRFMQNLQFRPAASSDTVTVPLRLRMQ
jgi:outer membrane biosynthesis protein TonB